MSQSKSLNIGIVCGEHSGDMLGAGIIGEIKKNSNIKLFGVGGPKLEELGVKSKFDFSELQIMGLIDPLLNIRKLKNLRNDLIKFFIKNDIDIFIGIDSPDFNIGIHKALKKKHKSKNIQIVSPSVWVWRQNRIKSIQAFIDLTVCLFDFEDSYYKKVKHNSIHLGHPFSDISKIDKKEVLNKYNLSDNNKFISILPGSRISEIKFMMPIFLQFINYYSRTKEGRDYVYLIPAADQKVTKYINTFLNSSPKQIIIKEAATQDFLSISEFSITTSGTATLESAVLGCPPIICYKTNFLNYSIISKMMKIKNIGLPNILLNKNYYPELVQRDCKLSNIKSALKRIPKLIAESEKNAELLKNILKGQGFSDTAKKIISLKGYQ
ncbi:MAG: lipid-A-disaccharide synthase [Gammaproteobacteria bacterium]|nr:lipid-A-disaccharide synthase [Gammaproteobacteria bacterium]